MISLARGCWYPHIVSHEIGKYISESPISIENRALIGYRGDEFSVEFTVTQVARTLRNSCDIVFLVKFNVEFPRHPLNFPIKLI